MVKDNVNLYFTNLLKDLQKQYSSLKGGQVYKATPPSFPYMYFKQIGGDGALSTLSNTEDGINLGLEVKFYSNKSSSEVRKLANSAREYMVGIGFHCECKRYFHFTIPYPILKTGNMINSIG